MVWVLVAREIMAANPLLPCEENGRLNDPLIRENFVARVYAYKHWQNVEESGLTKHKLTTFHSQYKYTVMSHDLVAYKKLGQLLARADLSFRGDGCSVYCRVNGSVKYQSNAQETCEHFSTYTGVLFETPKK